MNGSRHRVRRPIIVVGTGRCGSTMFQRLLARHPQVGWLSTFNEVFPTQPRLSAFSELYRQRLFSHRVKHLPFFPKPFEAYRFWEHYIPGFSRRDRPQTAADVPESAIEPLHRKLAGVLHHQRKERLLVKVTGWSRIGLFHRIFPDAQFIFLNREHRAVLSSWVQAGWLDVTSSPGSDRWQWGDVPQAYLTAWEELGGGPLLSAAVKIQLDLDDIRRHVASFQHRCLELQYEDLIAEPIVQLRRVGDFCGLRRDAGFEAEMQSVSFHDTREKWRKFLSEQEGEKVLEFFRRAQRAGAPPKPAAAALP